MRQTTKEKIRSLIKWFMILCGYHILSGLFYNILVKRMVTDLARDRYISRAHVTVLIFGVVALTVFCIWHSLTEARYTEYRDSLKKALAEENFSLSRYYISNFGKMNPLRCVVYICFQIPFMIFYAFFGFSAEHTTFFEIFYVIEAGFYQNIGNCVLGAILSALCLLVILSAVQFAFLFSNYRYVLENSPSLSRK